MSLIVLYFLHSTSVLSFYIDVVLTLAMKALLLFFCEWTCHVCRPKQRRRRPTPVVFTRCFVLFFIQGDVGIRSIGVRKTFHARWTLWYIHVVKLDYKVMKQLWEWVITWFLCCEWSCSVCDEFVCVWQASDNCAPNIALWVLWLLAVLVLLLYYRRHVHGRPLISVTLRVCRLCSWAKLGNATHFNSRHWGRSFMPDILQMDFKSNFWKKLLLLDTNLKEVCHSGHKWQQISNCLGNGLKLNRRKAIAQTNDDPARGFLYASLGPSVL